MAKKNGKLRLTNPSHCT